MYVHTCYYVLLCKVTPCGGSLRSTYYCKGVHLPSRLYRKGLIKTQTVHNKRTSYYYRCSVCCDTALQYEEKLYTTYGYTYPCNLKTRKTCLLGVHESIHVFILQRVNL